MERGESLYARWGALAVFVTPAIVSGTAKMPPYRFAVRNLPDSLTWTVPVAASAAASASEVLEYSVQDGARDGEARPFIFANERPFAHYVIGIIGCAS